MGRIPSNRLNRVEDLLSQGTATSTVAATCASEFNISERQAWRYIRKVYDSWTKEEEADRSVARHRRTRFLERIAQDAYQDREYSAAISALRQICRIEGLEQATKLQHTIDAQAKVSVTRDISTMTSDDKRRRLAELMDKASRAGGIRGVDRQIERLQEIRRSLEAQERPDLIQ